jgi:hypothetical protein
MAPLPQMLKKLHDYTPQKEKQKSVTTGTEIRTKLTSITTPQTISCITLTLRSVPRRTKTILATVLRVLTYIVMGTLILTKQVAKHKLLTIRNHPFTRMKIRLMGKSALRIKRWNGPIRRKIRYLLKKKKTMEERVIQ